MVSNCHLRTVTQQHPASGLPRPPQGGCGEGRGTWAGKASGLVTGELRRERVEVMWRASEGVPRQTGEP